MLHRQANFDRYLTTSLRCCCLCQWCRKTVFVQCWVFGHRKLQERKNGSGRTIWKLKRFVLRWRV